MAVDPNRFTKKTIQELAKRAAQRCSNPICQKPTSGPHTDDAKSTLTGKAAHIRGANRGSKRYDPAMTPQERRVITNGIWLCSDCSTLIDIDERRFSVEVLYRWKRQHEADVARAQKAQAGESERREQLQRAFVSAPPSVLQVVLDEPENWQHLLFVDLMRFRVRRQRQRREDLFGGFTFLPARVLSKYDYHGWTIERCHDVPEIVNTMVRVVTLKLDVALQRRPPDPLEVLSCVDAIDALCDALYDWESDVHRTLFPEEYADFKPRMRGWTNGFFEQIERLPNEMAKPLATPPTNGICEINLVFSVPPGVEDFVREHTKRIEEAG